ncbi:tRNA 2-selenouridine(34) synthase MnmH [Zhongshania sp.]|uniref:tRNA 2-selenouridine(34) synthase MnmH n=1 Tax=Zhongshania sp. TaxID=1971902 RepID=UPI00356B2512
MSKRDNSEDFHTLFLQDTPLLDVRAPVEFNKGAFPNTINIPLLDDEQRHAIGTRYKEQGQDAAIELGWQLATPEIKTARLSAWRAHIAKHPEGYLYCFRGGLRSNLSQQLIAETGIHYPLIKGGYKAMRRYLIDLLDEHSLALQEKQRPLILVSGRTGSGKTRVINRLARSVDLEGLARHRGSAFGRRVEPQPSQINFENALSIALLKLRHTFPDGALFSEDEGRMIGSAALPLGLQSTMQQAPLAVLETPLEERIDIALEEYVSAARPEYIQAFGEEQGSLKFREQILGNLDRIRRRLGGDRHKQLLSEFSAALDELERSGCADGFRSGIAILLSDYYDPMYDYQQTKRDGRVIFRGDKDAVVDWAQSFRPM